MTERAAGQWDRLGRGLSSGLGLIAIALVVMWAIEIVDTYALDNRLQRGGIHPRETDGIDGIAWAPFLHSGFEHLISNTVPLAVLGGLVSLRGLRYWAWVSVASIVLGGGLTWAFGGSGNHIGASGLVYGYFGALVGAAFIERNVRAMAAAFIPFFFYNTMLVGIVPQPQISWEGHLFGLVAGVLAAIVLRAPRKTAPDAAPLAEWELDEPWLDYDEP